MIEQELARLKPKIVEVRQGRELSLESAAELHALLTAITESEYVLAAIIVDHNGNVLAGATPDGMDPNLIAQTATSLYTKSTQSVQTMQQGLRLQQLVLKSPLGYFVVGDFGGGILVTITTDMHNFAPGGGSLANRF